MPQTAPFPVETRRTHEPARHVLRRNVGETERYLSIGGGLGLVLAGITRRGVLGGAMAAAGALLIGRGISGHCLIYEAMDAGSALSDRAGVPDNLGTRVEKTVLIDRPAAELYHYFREMHPLVRLMQGVEQIRMLNPDRALWTARIGGPTGRKVEWETTIINDHPGQLITWESLPGSAVQNAGTIRFTPAPVAYGEGTELKICMQTHIAENLFGIIRSTLLGHRPEVLLKPDALERLKHRLEAGGNF